MEKLKLVYGHEKNTVKKTCREIKEKHQRLILRGRGKDVSEIKDLGR